MNDYNVLTLNFQLENNRMLNESLFEELELESNFMLESLNNMCIIVEATNNNKVSFFERIKRFFNRLISLFKEKTNKIVDLNAKWLKDNVNKFKGFNYENLEIEILPFWNNNIDTSISEIKQSTANLTNLGKRNKVPVLYKDMELLKKQKFGKFLNEDGNLAEGCKNYFRTGNAKGPIKTVKLSNNNLKSKVENEFIPYCNGYKSNVAPKLNSLMTYFQKEMDIIQRALNSKETNISETFCNIENKYYKDTELSLLEDFIVLEAEKSTENKQSEKVSPTSVKVTNNQKTEDEKKQNQIASMSGDSIVALKNVINCTQTMVASLLTVSEETFSAYLNTLKQLLKSK